MSKRNAEYNLIEYMLRLLSNPERILAVRDEVTHMSVDSQYMQMANEIKSFLDEIPGGFLIYHAVGDEQIIYANKALVRIFGCETLEEFRKHTGNTFRGVVYKEDLAVVEDSIKQQICDSKYDLDYVEYRIVRKDGSVRWVEDYGHFIHSDTIGDIFYVFITDATEKRNRHIMEKVALIKEKKEKERKIQSLIDEYDKGLKLIHEEHLRRLEVIEGLSVNYDSILYVDLDEDTVLPYRLSSRTKHQFEDETKAVSYKRFARVHRYVGSSRGQKTRQGNHFTRLYPQSAFVE